MGELGIAVIERYTERFDDALKTMVADASASAMALLDFYTTPYLKFSETADKVCLSGALAGEIMALPADMRQRVEHFFGAHQAWLKLIIERGVASGEFHLTVPSTQMARLAFGAQQGALLVKRATGDTSQLKDVIAVLKVQLVGAARLRVDALGREPAAYWTAPGSRARPLYYSLAGRSKKPLMTISLPSPASWP